MQIKAQIHFEYETKKQATVALKSLKPDNIGYIKSYIRENKMVYNINSDSLNSFLATVDDLLFCEMMVEKVLELEK
ncbi:MAG: KEOPS complex subunit Pcc1 [Methanothermobacter sp.]